MTVHKGEDPAPEVPFVETRKNLLEDRDPSPSMISFNKRLMREMAHLSF
jgi:hypothetical protein